MSARAADIVRAAFLRQTDFAWEGERPLTSATKSAAVLVALVCEPERTSILLTRRTEHLHHHPGQICLPGGRLEGEETPIAAALREAEEEIGLQPTAVDVLGVLPLYATSSGFRVSPVVGVLHAMPRLRADSFEVAEVFDLPFDVLRDVARYQRHRIVYRGAHHHFYALPYGGRFIWGVTAGMLLMLAHFLAQE